MPVNIFIFAAPVKSGKTTTLMNWVGNKKNIGGLLAPDIDGLRRLYSLRDRQLHDYQLSDEAAAVAKPEEMVTICKFNFAAPAFASARQLLLEDSRQDFDWVIVDEIGKLELKGEGLEPAAAEVIEYYKTGRAKGRLLLIVRDELVEQAVKHYGLVEYRIIRLEEAMPH